MMDGVTDRSVDGRRQIIYGLADIWGKVSNSASSTRGPRPNDPLPADLTESTEQSHISLCYSFPLPGSLALIVRLLNSQHRHTPTMSENKVKLTVNGRIATITLNNAKQLNALDQDGYYRAPVLWHRRGFNLAQGTSSSKGTELTNPPV